MRIKFLLLCLSFSMLSAGNVNAAADSGRPARRSATAYHYREIAGTVTELMDRFSQTPAPETASPDEIYRRAGILNRDTCRKPKQQNDLLKTLTEEYNKVLEQYNELQILLQNIRAAIAENPLIGMFHAGDPALGRGAHPFFDHLAPLIQPLTFFALDELVSPQFRDTTFAQEARVQFDYFVDSAAVISAMCGRNDTAKDFYRLGMLDCANEIRILPISFENILKTCIPETFGGLALRRNPHTRNVVIFEDELRRVKALSNDLQPKGRIELVRFSDLRGAIRALPEDKRLPSQFAFLTMLQLAHNSVFTAEDIHRELLKFLRIEESGPVHKVYPFIAPRGVEITGFRKTLKRLKPTATPEQQVSLDLILRFMRQEEKVQTVKQASLAEALERAPGVWEDLCGLNATYEQDASRIVLTEDTVPFFKNDVYTRLMLRALELKVLLTNFTGADFAAHYQELVGIKNQLEEIINGLRTAFPPDVLKRTVSQPESVTLERIILPLWESGGGPSAYAEALKSARAAEATAARKAAAKATRDGATGPAPTAASVEETEPEDPAVKRAKESRKKALKKFKDNLPLEYEAHEAQIGQIINALKASDNFAQIREKLTERCGPGHNFEWVESEGVWSIRVNDGLRITFEVLVLEEVEQNNPLRITDVKISQHYRGL